jgi:hypothetical protein
MARCLRCKAGNEWIEGEVKPEVRSNVVVNLRWSNAVPTVPGWYWSRNHHGRTEIVSVVPHPTRPDVVCIMENSYCGWKPTLIENMGREWAGPIPEPEAN